jgi:Dyp-type peroxidase family
VIANADPALITTEIDRVRSELDMFGGRIIVVERGDQLKNSDNEAIEHFGYRDGVSQPLFFRNHDIKEKPKFDQHAPLKLVLSEDPSGPNRFGSYLVFRKLEQNPRGFESNIDAVVATPGVQMDRDLVGAAVIGRFKDGTPVVATSTPLGGTGDGEDFNYDNDDGATKCPFHAHIRKMNPRGEIPFVVNLLAREQTRRIARRGMTYGRPPVLGPDQLPPLWGVGLLFMCYQNDIADQFEFMQDTWANNRNFVKPGTGLDPVIGQSKNSPPQPAEFPNWSVEWNSDTRVRVQFHDVVRLLGGEYFFAPSMDTLRTI